MVPAGTATAAAPAVPDRQPGMPAVIPQAMLDRIEQAVASIPDADTDGGWGLLNQLFTATEMDDLNRPWQGTSGKTLAGRRLLIRSVSRRPSAFDGGPEIFLVVDSVDLGNGEQITWTSSALAVIVQLAVAYNRDWLPIVAEVTAAAKPTKSGFVPYHLNVTEIHASA